MQTTGLVLCIGELILLLGLVIVFLGLCGCCMGMGSRTKLFRCGMYFYLIAALLFFGCLIAFPFLLGVIGAESSVAAEITSVMGWGWGVVILVFTGALLLLLDKPPVVKESLDEEQKLL